MKISAVVLTKNEEKNIEKCLKSLSWCSEIVVVDDNSSDRTVSLVKRVGAKIYKQSLQTIKVYKRSLDNDFSGQRNFGLAKAKGDWILFVDADEVVDGDLRKEIGSKIGDTSFDGFYVKRQYFFLGKKIEHGEIGQTWLLRLGRKGRGKWSRAVHEEWNIEGNVGRLESVILHHPNKTIFDFVSDINRYSEIHALENMKEKKPFNFLFVIFHPTGKFFVNYFLRFGFLDGTPGFVIAVFMSFHSFLSWSRLWLNSQK